MFVLDRIRTSDSWSVFLAMYHRGHLSLYPGTTVYLAPLLRPEISRSALPEVVGTTIQQSSWPTVYRVSIALRDAPGVLHATLASVAKHGGNVLSLDSTSTDQESLHHVQMVVDFASLNDSGGGPGDLSGEIEGLLLADCYEHVVEDPGLRFGIRVRPHAGLRRLNRLLRKLRSSRYNSLVQEEQVAERGTITLKEPVIHMLRRGSVGDAITPPFAYFVSSDTKERVFRITFIPDERQVVWCAIRHDDRPGALSAITDQIRKSEITILSALNRVQRHQGRSWFEVILSRSDWAEVDRSTSKREVQDILDNEDLNLFSPAVFFDREEADRAMRMPAEDEATPAVWHLSRRQSVEEWLDEKEKLLEGLSGDLRIAEPGHSRPASKSALNLGIQKVQSARGTVRPRVFLSIEFSKINQVRIDIARSLCEAEGIEVDVVKETENQPLVREEVLGRISQATHFIGVWAPSEKDEQSKRCSPWLQWELGVASALRMPHGILVEKGTDTLDYQAIHGERYYFSFSAEEKDSFGHQFKRCLSLVLRSQVALSQF